MEKRHTADALSIGHLKLPHSTERQSRADNPIAIKSPGTLAASVV
jgi:hypothetical protein